MIMFNTIVGSIVLTLIVTGGLGAPAGGFLVALLQKSRLVTTVRLIFLLFLPVPSAFSQDDESSIASSTIRGAVTITNKGVSTIPSFTLGKPAVILDASIGKEKLTFDPQLRFALDGKPWSFLFRWRYKFRDSGKYRLSIGVHPSLSFRTKSQVSNGTANDVIVARRFLAGELSSGYSLTPIISIGTYYLYLRGFESSTAKNTHFVGLSVRYTSALFFKHFSVVIRPQVYYLRMDGDTGTYVTSTFSLANKRLPVSLSAIFNKTLRSNISGVEDFLWSMSVVYSFDI